MIALTKIQIPPISKTIISRPKLMSRLDAGMETKLTLVSAQAGYGKTTALSVWAKQCSAIVAWVSLDRLNNDWSSFWSCVLASIRESVPGFGASISFLTEQESAASYESAMAALINELHQVIGEMVIIADDFQFIELPAIHQSISYLVNHLPAHIHLYIASRSELPVSTARWLARREINAIGMADMRFEPDEGIVFFRNITDLSLTKEQALELYRQTEGWVSGLQLAAITLKRSGNIAESIQQFNGRQRHISDYLLEEIWQHQPKEQRDFLLATSVLSRMNKELCQAVTGRADSQAQLERLERLNLFIVPLDDERSWYRYHHLLSDFLQRVALEDEDNWLQHHIRAARWLEEHGFVEEAAEHYVNGRQGPDAVRLIERHMHDFMLSNRSALMRWISALPESLYEDKPMVQLIYISSLVAEGEWNAALQKAAQSESRFQALRGRLPEPAWNRAMGDLYYFCGIISYLRQDLHKATFYLEQLERHLPEGSSFQNIAGNRYEGYDHFTDLLSLNHDFMVVEQFLLKWINAWEHKKYYPFVGFQYVTYIMLLYERDRTEEARLYLGKAMEREDLRSMIWFRVQLNILSARLLHASGDDRQAAGVLERLKHDIDSPDMDLILRKIEAEEALLLLHQGKLREALAWAERCDLSHTDEVYPLRLDEHLALAKVLAANGLAEAATTMLERLNGLPEMNRMNRDRIKLMIVQSTVLYEAGCMQAAYAALQTALRLAESAGYIRSFIDEGLTMDKLLHGLTRQRHTSVASSVPFDYAERLLQGMKDKTSQMMPKDSLTEREATVLLMLADGLVNKEIAERLHITPETVKFHLKNVYRKLGVHNRVQAVQAAGELGLLHIAE